MEGNKDDDVGLSSDIDGKGWNPQIIVNFPFTNVPGCVSRNVITLRLHQL